MLRRQNYRIKNIMMILMTIKISDNDDIQEVANNEKPSDYEPDIQELSSDEETSNAGVIPPVLDGSLLKSGSKCDWCKTLVTNKDYRMLPEGPVKDFIVTETFGRETSPERVCNPYWSKVHKAAQITSEVKTRVNPGPEQTEPNIDYAPDLITIPSYKRFSTTASECIVNDCDNSQRLRVPDYLRTVLLKSYNIFVPESSRICQEHCKEYYREHAGFIERRSFETS